MINTNVEQTVSLMCRASGNPEPQVIWINRGGVLNDNCSGGMLDSAFGEAALDYNTFYNNLTDFDHLFVREVMGEAPEAGRVRNNCSISIYIDHTSLPVTVSVLTIRDLHLLESATFVCVAENGVENLLNTSEAASVQLMIDSELIKWVGHHCIIITS